MNSIRTPAEKAFQREVARELREILRRADRMARRVACQQCQRELRRGPRGTGDFGDGTGDYVGEKLPRPLLDRHAVPLEVRPAPQGGYLIVS